MIRTANYVILKNRVARALSTPFEVYGDSAFKTEIARRLRSAAVDAESEETTHVKVEDEAEPANAQPIPWDQASPGATSTTARTDRVIVCSSDGTRREIESPFVVSGKPSDLHHLASAIEATTGFGWTQVGPAFTVSRGELVADWAAAGQRRDETL